MGAPGEEEGGGLKQPVLVLNKAVKLGGDPLGHKVQAFLIRRYPARYGRVLQIVEHPHPNGYLLRSGLLQAGAQGGLGQQVRKDNTAGQQGNRQQNSQEHHQFQGPVGDNSPTGYYICQIQQRHRRWYYPR